MVVTFFDIEDDSNSLNGTVIRDSERLLQILEGLRGRRPFVCELVGNNGFELTVGIGAHGFAQYGRRDFSAGFMIAIAPGKELEEGDIEFLAGRTPTPISKRYCMPFESVCDIARHFLEAGSPHPAFLWEEPG
jgi:hypothetical protein